MLQADGSAVTNQLLALGVSSQLRTTGQTIAPSMNATLTSLADPPIFVPSSAIRWINILFFLSLVFSLAAALFGILAKQWLREYIAWSSPLADPRENVIVRQERFEDWESWNVAATISAIPALLELAMILFLVGVTVLLWTLDDIVAIVVTVAVTVFLGAVLAFTILPIFFRQCPYRSPTAWAFLRLVEFTRCTVVLFAKRTFKALLYNLWLGFIRVFPPSPADNDRPTWLGRAQSRLWTLSDRVKIKPERFVTQKTWRDGDLGKREVHPPWWKHGDVLEAAKRELRCERMAIDSNQVLVDHWENSFVNDAEARSTLRNIIDTATLLRALSWVHRASQDERVQQYVSEALETLHPAHSHDINDPMGPRLVADWCLLLAMERDKLKHPLLFLHSSTFLSDDSSPLIPLRKRTGVFTVTEENTVHLNTARTAVVPQFNDHVHMPILIGVIATDLAQCVSLLQKMCMSQQPSFARAAGNTSMLLMVRRVYELISILNGLQMRHILINTFQSPLLRSLCTIFSADSVKDQLDFYAPSLRVQSFRLACQLGHVSVGLNQNTIRKHSAAILACTAPENACTYRAHRRQDDHSRLHAFYHKLCS